MDTPFPTESQVNRAGALLDMPGPYDSSSTEPVCAACIDADQLQVDDAEWLTVDDWRGFRCATCGETDGCFDLGGAA